jgi:hypothetical protein
MPPLYIVFHLLAALLGFYLTWRARKRPALRGVIGLGALLLLLAGLTLERRTDIAWRLIPYTGPNLVFLCNVALEAVTLLFALLWSAAARREERLRAGLLFVPLLAVALWSYAWYFEPLPPGIDGRLDRWGFCRQTTGDSCSAAAAVMLLARYGILTTEPEMAAACLTRAGKGTSPLGLYRGLALKAGPHGLQPRLIQVGGAERLRDLRQPAILNVGLKADTPYETANRLQSYGWSADLRHTVLVWGTAQGGAQIDVADPSYGMEQWPADDLKYLWDGTALILVRR